MGDICLALKAGLIRREQVTQLEDVLIGKADGRRSAGDITLFDRSGLAIQDLAIAKLAYSKVDELDGLHQIELKSLLREPLDAIDQLADVAERAVEVGEVP